jgi:DNA-binding MarR family transcriptional regulator
MKKEPNATAPRTTETVFHALLKTWGLIRQVQEPYFARFGITASQWGMLRVLHRAETNGETELSFKDLSERLMIQPPSVTIGVDRLERQKLVERHISKADLRMRMLRLTPEGRAMVEEVLKRHAERIKLLLAGLNEKDQETLHSLLNQLRAHLATLIATDSGGAAAPATTEKI